MASVKMIKFSDDIISDFIYHNYNNSLFSMIFPSVLQKADISPIHKKKSKLDIENYQPVSTLQSYLKFMSDVCLIKCMPTSITFCQNISVVSVKVTVRNIAFSL